jgi:hypothetical protein
VGGAVSTQVVKLRTENEALRRNISVLYNTAKAEMARKDAEITALRLEAAQRQRGPGAANAMQQGAFG